MKILTDFCETVEQVGIRAWPNYLAFESKQTFKRQLVSTFFLSYVFLSNTFVWYRVISKFGRTSKFETQVRIIFRGS